MLNKPNTRSFTPCLQGFAPLPLCLSSAKMHLKQEFVSAPQMHDTECPLSTDAANPAAADHVDDDMNDSEWPLPADDDPFDDDLDYATTHVFAGSRRITNFSAKDTP